MNIVDAYLQNTFNRDPERDDDEHFRVGSLLRAIPGEHDASVSVSSLLLERIDSLIKAKDIKRINRFLNEYGESFLENAARQALENDDIAASATGRVQAVFGRLKEMSALADQAENGTVEQREKALFAVQVMQSAGIPLVELSGDVKQKNMDFLQAFHDADIEDACSILFDMRFLSEARLQNALQMRRSLEKKGVRVKWVWASDQYSWQEMSHTLSKYESTFRRFGVDFSESMHIDTQKPWDSDKAYSLHVTAALRQLAIQPDSLMILANQASYERFYRDLGISIEIVNRMMASSESMKIELSEAEYAALSHVLAGSGKALLDMARIYRKDSVWILEVDPLAVNDSEFFDRVYKTMAEVAKMA